MFNLKMKKEILFEKSKVWGICWTLRKSGMWKNNTFLWETTGKIRERRANKSTFKSWELMLFPRASYVFWPREGLLWEALLECPGGTGKWSVPDHPASLRRNLSPLHLCLSSRAPQLGVWELFATYAPMLPISWIEEMTEPCNVCPV